MNQMSSKTLKYILACSTEKGCETKEQIKDRGTWK